MIDGDRSSSNGDSDRVTIRYVTAWCANQFGLVLKLNLAAKVDKINFSFTHWGI
jgi:hypothetical protein